MEAKPLQPRTLLHRRGHPSAAPRAAVASLYLYGPGLIRRRQPPSRRSSSFRRHRRSSPLAPVQTCVPSAFLQSNSPLAPLLERSHLIVCPSVRAAVNNSSTRAALRSVRRDARAATVHSAARRPQLDSPLRHLLEVPHPLSGATERAKLDSWAPARCTRRCYGASRRRGPQCSARWCRAAWRGERMGETVWMALVKGIAQGRRRCNRARRRAQRRAQRSKRSRVHSKRRYLFAAHTIKAQDTRLRCRDSLHMFCIGLCMDAASGSQRCTRLNTAQDRAFGYPMIRKR